jgi:S-formylglutathione hydrolase FrmB
VRPIRRLAIAAAVATSLAAGGDSTLAADRTSPVCIPRSAPIPQGPATLVDQSTVDGTAGRMRRVRLDSPGLGAATSVNVLLPESYDDSGATRYPVLYLLHGAIGSYDDWRWGGDVVRIVEEVSRAHDLPPFIVVMPDGGKWGFYTDWYGTDAATGEPDPPPAWTKYHVGELIPWVDANFPTRASREGRAVAGLSMGGFGAMSYAARFPHVFSAAGSFSGAVHPNLGYPFGNAFLTLASTYFDEGNVRNCVWGDMVTQRVHWHGHDPTYLAENLRHTSLFIASGGGDHTRPDGLVSDPVEETVYLMSRALATALDEEGIAHTDHFYGSGTHTWPYWQDDLRRFLPHMAATWANPPTHPPTEPFSFRTAHPLFSVWGWRFEADRGSTEFTYLDDVDATGLDVTGSGTLAVTTAPLYASGRRYEISDGEGTMLVRAHQRRLSFDIDLGPAHESQQERFDGEATAAWKHARVDIRPAGR